MQNQTLQNDFKSIFLQDRLRELYDQWLDSGNQTRTAAGNVRAPSRTDICNMVVAAWNGITEEMIAKSFLVCGQLKKGTPSDVTCMKEGRSAAQALEDVKAFWNYKAEDFEEINQEIEVDEDEDPMVIDSDGDYEED